MENTKLSPATENIITEYVTMNEKMKKEIRRLYEIKMFRMTLNDLEEFEKKLRFDESVTVEEYGLFVLGQIYQYLLTLKK
jgi:hypothetical protein